MNPFTKLAPAKKKVMPMPKPHREPDADEKGGKSDHDADDKGFMALRFKGKKGKK